MPGLRVPSWHEVVGAVSGDPNVRNFRRLAASHGPGIPRATRDYLLAKIPIVQWITHYSPSWLLNDILAGITIGVLLVPQSLAYAKVANLSSSVGLISSWMPTLFYALMGTSKDVTAGPTAIMGLLTGEIVTDFVAQGYSAHAVASACAFWAGIYSLALGLLRLGFLLDFIPAPVLSGYVGGAALTIVLQQLKALFGEGGSSGSDTAEVIRLFFQKLPTTNWRAFLVGFSGVVLLVAMQTLGRTLGKRSRPVWFFAMARNALALVLFTLISWGVNRHRASDPLFSISKVTGAGIEAPRSPDTNLLVAVAGRSVVVFVAAALEHLAIGKAFGRRYGYVIDEDQELSYIGVVNLFGSFFGCMPVTGGFSRTAVNAESGVKSPLGGLVTSACVLVSIYKLTGAFYWIPSATLSAIIVVAVWQIIPSPRVFAEYWRTSLADFVASMVAFWVTLFVSVEIGIAAAVACSLVYVLLQLAFARVTLVTAENVAQVCPIAGSAPLELRGDAMVFVLQSAVLYPNAARIARQIGDHIWTYSAPADANVLLADRKGKDRIWNETRQRRVAALRKQAGVGGADLPLLRFVVLDMTRVAHLDTTGLQALADIRSVLIDWTGEGAELRLVGLNDGVRERVERGGHLFGSGAHKKSDDGPRDAGYIVFDVLQTALHQEPSLRVLDEEAGSSGSQVSGKREV